MIYGYGLYYKIYIELLNYLPHRHILNIAKDYKLLKMAQPNDLVLFFNWTKHSRKVQKELMSKGVHLFPRGELSLLIGDKIKQLKALENISQFPMLREYVEISEPTEVVIPAFLEQQRTVLKIGNEHQGLNKFLKKSGEKITLKENGIFEEYISNSRSIRILALTRNIEDIFIVEHINSDEAKLNPNTSWIKNIDPIETVYPYRDRYKAEITNIDEVIEDAIRIMNFFDHDYMGLDYVVSEHKIGFLEANDMIGLPENDEVYEKAIAFFKRMVNEYYQIN